MDSVTHKVAHGALGAVTGAVLSKDWKHGAISGAIGGVVSEVVSETLSGDVAEKALARTLEEAEETGQPATKERYDQLVIDEARKRADLGKIASAVTTLAAGQDVDVAVKTATNAVENNFLGSVAIHALGGANANCNLGFIFGPAFF